MNPIDTERELPRTPRRPGHDRDDSRQERERDYVKEVHETPRPRHHGRERGRDTH